MTFHLKRFIVIGLSLLVLAAAAPLAANWVRTKCQLPAGYGAEGDRRRAVRMPGAVRASVERMTVGSEGTWVKERVERGTWVYELHIYQDGKSSIFHISTNGKVTAPLTEVPETSSAALVAE